MTNKLTGREPALPTADGLTGREPFIGGDASIIQALLQLDDADFASTEVLAARLAGVLPHLAALLNDEDQRKRSQAARLIGMVAVSHPPSRAQSVPLLVGILDDAVQRRDWPTMLMAVEFLGNTSDQQAVSRLVDLVEHGAHFEHLPQIISALVQLGETALSPLFASIRQQGSRHRDYLLMAVTGIARAHPQFIPDVTTWITPLILERQLDLDYTVYQLLQTLCPTELIISLLQVAQDREQDPQFRKRVLGAFAYLSDPRIPDLMFELLENDDTVPRRQTERAICAHRRREDIPRIIALIRHSDPRIRRSGLFIAGRRKLRSAIPAVLEALSDGQGATRQYAVIALWRIRESSTLPALCGMIDDRAKPVRRTIVTILARLHPHFSEHQMDIIAALRKASRDPDEEVKRMARWALHHLGASLEAP
ncbi:MAG: HEAT repeat domain-containing protein [Anaerolineae bacterium]|nr:HEAT repeat domain-containing protein [Anaerolineae bacterium]